MKMNESKCDINDSVLKNRKIFLEDVMTDEHYGPYITGLIFNKLLEKTNIIDVLKKHFGETVYFNEVLGRYDTWLHPGKIEVGLGITADDIHYKYIKFEDLPIDLFYKIDSELDQFIKKYKSLKSKTN